MKEPFIPKSTISEMLPLSKRMEFFARICPNGSLAHFSKRVSAAHWPVHVPAARTNDA